MVDSQISWQYFPKSTACPSFLVDTIGAFIEAEDAISLKSSGHLVSDEVLKRLRPSLVKLGYMVESGKSAEQKIKIPVLFGPNGKIEKSFDADAHHLELKVVLEVESGRAVSNYQFLKDLFQACVMFDIEYLAIAVRNDYRGSDDFKKVTSFIETLYVSPKFKLPLTGVLIIGY